MPRNAVAFIIIHPQLSKRVTAKSILVSPASKLVGEWLQRQRHFWAWSLYVLSKWDDRHRMHCLFLTDMYNLTKGKPYRVNQRWRHTMCLQHPCYDVGCTPELYMIWCATFLMWVSLIECSTRDRRAGGSSVTGVTALWSLSKKHLS